MKLIRLIVIFAMSARLMGDLQLSDHIDCSDRRKKALIFGINGQDGFYLAELLLKHNYEVHGASIEPLFAHNFHCYEKIMYHHADISKTESVKSLVADIQPDEIYNLAAQSSVSQSFEKPVLTTVVNSLGTLNILEAIKVNGLITKTRFFHASSSEIFGGIDEHPQDENILYTPTSPYGISKLFAHMITQNYRTAHKIFACNGILYNHESPKRPSAFVTRKISNHVAQYACGKKEILFLGNLHAQRDWGFAGDYVEAMWLALQGNEARDYIIATGEMHSVKDFVETAYRFIGIEVLWQGEGINETGINKANGDILVKIDPVFFRPTESYQLNGDVDRTKKLLNWSCKTSFVQLVKMMVQADIYGCQNEMH